MGSWACPLCCGQLFTSIPNLIQHIVDLYKKFQCPFCEEKLHNGSLEGIVQHITSHTALAFYKEHAVEYGVNKIVIHPTSDVLIVNVDVNDGTICVEQSTVPAKQTTLNAIEESEITKKVQPAVEESRVNKASQLSADSKVKDTSQLPTDSQSCMVIPVDDDLEKGSHVSDDTMSCDDNDNSEVYSCSTCQVTFSSVYDHIQKHHSNEEVMLQVPGGTDLENVCKQEGNCGKGMKQKDDNKNENEMTVCEADSVESEIDIKGSTKDRKKTKRRKFKLHKRKRLISVKEAITKKTDISQEQEVHTSGANLVESEGCQVKDIDGRQYIKKLPQNAESTENNALSDAEIFHCVGCLKTFSSLENFRLHTCKLLGDEPISCDKCNLPFESTAQLRKHKRTHVENSLMKNSANSKIGDAFQCEVCGNTYTKAYEKVHMMIHRGETRYECDYCDKRFYNIGNLKLHKRKHLGQKPYCCALCSKSYSDSNALKEHTRSHTGEKPYECSFCGKGFSRRYECTKHERIHTGEKPHKCKICDKSFRVSYCLTLHMRTHTGERRYTCEHCDKQFKANSVYKHHLKIHSDEREYLCKECGKTFKTSVQLAGHVNSHTKPYVCPVCNRRFSSLYSVRVHMSGHKKSNKNLNHKCFVCGASYGRAYALENHLKTHGSFDVAEEVAENLELKITYEANKSLT